MRIDSEYENNLNSYQDIEFDNYLKDIDLLCNELSELHAEHQSHKKTSIDDIDEVPEIKIVYPREYFENPERRIIKYYDFNYIFIFLNVYCYCCFYLSIIQNMKNSKIYSKGYH